MSKEIRRTRTDDPEMDAINIIAQALAPLDQAAAGRVVTWADKRYVHPDPALGPDGLKSINKFMEAMHSVAQEMSISPPEKILNAMSLVVTEMREQRKLEAGTPHA